MTTQLALFTIQQVGRFHMESSASLESLFVSISLKFFLNILTYTHDKHDHSHKQFNDNAIYYIYNIYYPHM